MKKRKILITGCAGFIGFHLAKELLQKKQFIVFGLDNLNNYYDLNLKKNRLKVLKNFKDFIFNKIDIQNNNKLKIIFKKIKYDYVVHLAAQAGVRFSIKEPRQYFDCNVEGFYNILERAKESKVKHFIYASTSSVYGNSKKFPLKESDNTSMPVSFYAATKKINEIMAYSYSSIYKLPTTGLRFFTVYGPYGRPDMSLYKFTESIIFKKDVLLFNNGNHVRDFTYIDDVINSIIKLIKKPSNLSIPFDIYNIGSNNPQKLKKYLSIIEKSLSLKAKKNLIPFQLGDVKKTHADINKLQKKTHYKPNIKIEKGIALFIKWYKEYFNLK